MAEGMIYRGCRGVVAVGGRQGGCWRWLIGWLLKVAEGVDSWRWPRGWLPEVAEELRLMFAEGMVAEGGQGLLARGG